MTSSGQRSWSEAGLRLASSDGLEQEWSQVLAALLDACEIPRELVSMPVK
jgi:hypothetical protein